MNKYEEYNKQLMSCHCGGDVVIEGGTPGYPTFSVRCLRCGGRWSMDTYSPEEAVNKWGRKILRHPRK